MRCVAVQTRTLAEVKTSIVGREDAEFVALRVGKHHPGLLALTDVDVPSTQTDQAVHFGLLVVGPEVEMDAVLDDLVVGHVDKQPVGSGAGRGLEHHVAVLADMVPPAQHLRPPGTECLGVVGVDADLVERQSHPVNSFFSTLPIALRGRLSTSRTSRGRLCAESCCATKSINACGSASPTTNATIRWPRSSSGTPITAASSTPAWPSSTVSISPAPTRKPPVLIRSTDSRPTIRCMRSPSIVATSPVRYQSSSNASAVASGLLR